MAEPITMGALVAAILAARMVEAAVGTRGSPIEPDLGRLDPGSVCGAFNSIRW